MQLLKKHQAKVFKVIVFIRNTFVYILYKLGLLRDTSGKLKFFQHKGINFTNVVHSIEVIKAISDYDAFRPEDVVVMTYPKTGTHFLCDVINTIYVEAGLIPKPKQRILNIHTLEIRPPMFDRTYDGFTAELDGKPGPRVIGTHIPWSMLPQKVKSHQVKVIQVIRNPKDVACSTYAFYKALGLSLPFVTWDMFLSQLFNKEVLYGDYFDFMKQWYPYRNSPNNMYIYYEDMIKDLSQVTLKIAKFLGIQLTDSQVKNVVWYNTFSAVVKDLGNTIIHRQGQAGAWKSQFTVEQNERADAWISNGMIGLDDIKFQYE